MLDELARGALADVELAARQTERGGGVTLQCRAVDVFEPPPVRFDPREILAAREASASGDERAQGRAPRASPPPLRNRRFSSVNSLLCRLEVDPGIGREKQSDLAPPLHPVEAHSTSKPREDAAQGAVGVRGHVVCPEGVDEFLSARVAVTVEREKGEQQAPL